MKAPPTSLPDLAGHALVGYVEDQIYAPELRYLEEIDPALRPRLSSSSLRAQRQMVAAGGGVGVLPCFMAQGLARVLEQEVRLTRRFWISTHRDVAGTARIRAVRQWMKDLVLAEQAVLNPSDPAGQPATASTSA